MPQGATGPIRNPDLRLGEFLTRARERAGFSIRALARTMEVSPATVLEAERGRNPRASTLEAYLRALPDVSPHALLQAGTDCAPAASPAAWLHYRDLHGFSAERMLIEATVGRGGLMRRVLRVTGLRSHRASLREDLQERTLLLSSVTLGSPAVMRSLRYLEQEALGHRHRIEDGGAVHDYTFPSALDRVGIGYRCTEERVSTSDSDLNPLPFAHGLRADVRLPVASLSLRLDLETGVPSGVRPAAWLRHQAIHPGDQDILAELYPGGLPLRWSRGGRRCALEVEQPLVGTCLGLGWDGAS